MSVLCGALTDVFHSDAVCPALFVIIRAPTRLITSAAHIIAGAQFARATKDAAICRRTSPLDPEYMLPSAAHDSHPHPVSAMPSKTVEGHVFERHRHPDWTFNRGSVPTGTQNSDIECSTPARTRLRVCTPR